MGAFLCLYNGPLKGQFSSVPSCYTDNSHTPLLLNTNTKYPSFRYVIDEVLGLWMDLGWYFWLVFICWHCWLVFLCWYFWLIFLCWCCWMVFLWVCWCWFGTFWCWNVFTKFMFTMGSIIEWDAVISISDFSWVSKF